MQKKVFISFVEADLKIAKKIKNKLLEEGISTWIYTEDNIAGDYRAGIIQAITNSKVMILIFSRHTENSLHISRELREAAEKNVTIIPFFIENIKTIKDANIRYEIQTLNWIQGWKYPFEKQIDILIDQTKNILSPNNTPLTSPSSPNKNWTILIIFLILLGSIILATKAYLHIPFINDLQTRFISPKLLLFDGDINIQNSQKGFRLSWKKQIGNINMYELYRSENNGDLGTKIYSGKDTNFTNTGLVNGIIYYYTAKACNNDRCYSSTQNHKRYDSKTLATNETFIKKFLTDYLIAGEQNSPDKLLKFYASIVQPYLNIEKASRQQILQDKINFIKRWPYRKYVLNSFTILDIYQDKNIMYLEVSYTYDWKVRSNKLGTKFGIGTSIMKIQKKGDRFHIIGIRDIVSNKEVEINDKNNLNLKD